MYSTTLSDEEMTKVNVVDLDDLYNFYVDDFFSNFFLKSCSINFIVFLRPLFYPSFHVTVFYLFEF